MHVSKGCRTRLGVSLVGAILFFTAILSAADVDALQKENEELRKRVASLEAMTQDILKTLNSVDQEPALSVTASTTSATDTVPALELDVLKAQFLQTEHKTGMYGYIRADLSHDTSRVVDGNRILYVESEENRNDDDLCNLTARQTRLGFTFRSTSLAGPELSGRIETDFYGKGTENSPTPRMRQAYVKLYWPELELSLLAGQAWDIIAPLNLPTVNFASHFDTGNMGFRRPQVQVAKGFQLGCDSRLLLQAGIMRTIGEDGPYDPGDTGEDAGFPSFQGRISFAKPLWLETPAQFGLSAHWGQEEYDIDAFDSNEEFDTWSLNFDMKLPLTQKLTLSAEVWRGANLDVYFGGIGQGVNTVKMKEIDAWGGWVALSIGPFDKWKFACGIGVDDPDDRDLNDGQRSRNFAIFGNVHYQLNANTTFGFEVSRWETDYKGQDDADAMRYHSALTYTF